MSKLEREAKKTRNIAIGLAVLRYIDIMREEQEKADKYNPPERKNLFIQTKRNGRNRWRDEGRRNAMYQGQRTRIPMSAYGHKIIL